MAVVFTDDSAATGMVEKFYEGCRIVRYCKALLLADFIPHVTCVD